MEVKLGQTIDTAYERRGIVRYVGEVTGINGIWVGLELPTPTGKNDGSVRGERYFQCAPLKGIFIKKDDVARIVAQPAPKPAPRAAPKPAAPKPAAPKAATPKAAAPAAKSRPSSIGAAKPLSQPSSRLSSIGAPKTTTLGRTPSTQASGRPSSFSAAKASAQPDAKSTQPAPLAKRQSTIGALKAPRKPSLSSTSSTTTTAPSSSSATVSRPGRDAASAADTTKVRQLEKQLADANERLVTADHDKAERERMASLLDKMQTKARSQHQKYAEAEAMIKEKEAEITAIRKEKEELEIDNENATIDREMAEERAEQLLAELEDAHAQLEELKLELEIRGDEASLITDDMTEEEKKAAAFHSVVMERDRYREGILMLKEHSTEEIRRLKARNAKLEAQLEPLDDLEKRLVELEEKSAVDGATIVHLREQVDSSNEWEDMLEEVTDKYNVSEEKNSRLNLAIRELEIINEVNNETIAEYVMEVDYYQSEMETKDIQLTQVTQERDLLSEETVKLSSMLSRYHTTVLEYQEKMSEIQNAKFMTDEEIKNMTGRFNEAMELTRQSRDARVHDTGRSIDHSLQQLSTEEAVEELGILQHYLPGAIEDYKNDSLNAYFRAKKISHKASLAVSSLSTTADASFGTTRGPDQALEDVFRYDAVYHLDYIRAFANHFRASVTTCTLEQYDLTAQSFGEMAPVEKSLQNYLDAVRQDRIASKEFSETARGSYEVMRMVVATQKYNVGPRPDIDLIMHASFIKASLERIRISFDTVKVFLVGIEFADSDGENGIGSVMSTLLEPGRAAMECVGVAAKLSQTLITLQNDGLYPQFPGGVEELSEQSEVLVKHANESFDFARLFLTQLSADLAEASSPPTLDAVSRNLRAYKESHVVDDFHDQLKNLRSRIIEWHEYASVLMNNVEIERQPAPWVLKAQEIDAAKKCAIDAQTQLQVLRAEHRAILVQVHEREETISTKELEIEHLKAKHQEAASKAGSIELLQQEVDSAKSEAVKYRQQYEAQRHEIHRLQTQAESRRSPEEMDKDLAELDAKVERDREAQPAPVAQPLSTNASGTFVTFIRALTDENHWLRQRENSEMFGYNLNAMFARMRNNQAALAKTDSRHKQARADEMLDMSLNMHTPIVLRTPLRSVQDDSDFMNDMWTPDFKSTRALRESTRSTSRSRRRAALQLDPIQTSLSWLPTSSAPEASFADLEDLSFIDLSPVAEEFATEMTNALEEFSEVMISA